MRIVLTGTGTSHGIPVIGCKCEVCTSLDMRDKRDRTSAFVFAEDGTTLVIDTSPEFRHQALRYGLTKADGVLITHSHADHVHGLDDLRIFSHTWNPKKVKKNFKPNPPLKIYLNKGTLNDIKKRFDYIFMATHEGGGKPNLELVEVKNFSSFSIGCLDIIPIPIKHGCLDVCGWKITDKSTGQSLAYITDCNYVSDESIETIKGVKHCVLDSLREEKHSTHFCFAESVECAKKIQADNTWFTHLCHDFSHTQLEKWLHKNGNDINTVAPAYDGLTLEC